MTDSGRPPDAWEAPRPRRALPEPTPEPGPPSTPSRRLGPLAVIGFVVVALIAGVAAGWALFRPGGLLTPASTTPSASTQPTAAPPPTSETSVMAPPIRTVPFDLGQGPADKPTNLALAAGVAVFSLRDTATNQVLLRGVDAATGSVLWTYDKMPDGKGANGISTSSSWQDHLAVSAVRNVFPGERCAAGYIVVLAIKTGEAVASQVVNNCVDPETQVTYDIPVVTAYEDGILAIDTMTHTNLGPCGTDTVCEPAVSITATTGYRDTDLAHPLWQIKNNAPVTIDYTAPARASDTVLPGGWVYASTGAYVRLTDGKHANLKVQDGNVFLAAGTTVIEGVSTTSKTNGTGDVIKGWTTPDATAPAWTTPLEPGWILPPTGTRWSVACASDDVAIVPQMHTAAGSSGDQRFAAISLRDGKTLWTSPADPTKDACDFFSNGGQQMVGLGLNGEFRLVDAMTGIGVGVAGIPISPYGTIDIRPCHGVVCVISTGDAPGYASLTVSRIDAGASSPTVLDQTTLRSLRDYVSSSHYAYDGSDGSVIVVGQTADGQNEFLYL